jgi:nitrogenase molybdenum-iron protein NifN
VHSSTPSYRDGHIEGFHSTVYEIVKALATGIGERECTLNVLPPILSPADLRHLRECINAFGVEVIMVPDYSDTLDGVILDEYKAFADGGTPVEHIARMPRARASLDLTLTGKAPRASGVLQERGVRARVLGLPIGVRATDAMMSALEEDTGTCCPDWLTRERGRLLDAYADGHKYVFGKRVAVYGDPENVTAIARFLAEIGACPVVCATGSRNRALTRALGQTDFVAQCEILDDADFDQIEASCRESGVELLIGNSKGYPIARRLGIPLVRTGFPIHDRIGATRVQTLGYRGTLCLFDAIVNAILEQRQDASDVGYAYL